MLEKILETIKKYDSIVIYGHIYADGDSFGSQVAVQQFIKLNWPKKKVYVTGAGFKCMYEMLGKPDVVSDEVIRNSLAIAVDFNELYRSEDQRIMEAKELIIIDHHLPGETTFDYTSTYVINPDILSCCTILYTLFKQSGLKTNRKLRNALFLGITTDTNRFLFLEPDALSFNVAHSLTTEGIDMVDIYKSISKTSAGILKIKGYVLSNYQIYKDKITWCVLPKDIIKTSGFTGYPGYIVNQLANVDSVESWVLFIQQSDKEMSVEFRSAEKNIRPIAVKYGGGGHKRACGIQKCPMSHKLIDSIMADLYEHITNYVEPDEED